MVTDTISDLLVRVQNAIRARKRELIVSNTKLSQAVLKVIKKEDMIQDYAVNGSEILVVLKYVENQSVIEKLKKISTPGRRIYIAYKDISPVMNGRGISIISTSQGVMSGALAKSKQLGGELICHIW